MKKNGVLCAIDVNDFDQEIVDIAASFAKNFQLDLHLLHVTQIVEPTSAAWTAYFGTPNQLVADKQRLKQIDTNIEGVNVVRHQASGSPEKQILGFAERNQPRLLIIGQHYRKGIQQLLGDVGTKVMRKACCPVLIFRERKNRTSQSPKQTSAA